MEENPSIAVLCKQITKTYGTGETAVHALRGVDLEVKEGELLMVVGPSGSGKTTLISIIAAILEYDAGECLIFGKDVGHAQEEEKTFFRHENIGFVFQAFNLIPTLTAAENTAVPLLFNGTDRKTALEQARNLLAQFGLSDKLDAFPPQLSGGQQQRVAIARAVIHNPKLIVCDEPTSSLDHETGIKVLELLRESVLTKGRSLIVVTHDPRIFPLADRIVKMEDGRIVS